MFPRRTESVREFDAETLHMKSESTSTSMIKVAIVGCGNCAKSLVEGVSLYSGAKETPGLTFRSVGGYECKDIKFVAAWDVDARKVGKPLAEALVAPPNCAMTITGKFGPCCEGVVVRKGQVLDGVGPLMLEHPEKGETFCVDPSQPEDSREEICRVLRETGADVLLNYLPVGS